MRSLPPGWPDRIPGLPLLFVFVGAPECHEHAQRQKALGFCNHVVLADIQHAFLYHWPTAGLMVIVIVFAKYSAIIEARFMAELLLDKPLEVALRYWPGQHVIRCTP